MRWTGELKWTKGPRSGSERDRARGVSVRDEAVKAVEAVGLLGRAAHQRLTTQQQAKGSVGAGAGAGPEKRRGLGFIRFINVIIPCLSL